VERQPQVEDRIDQIGFTVLEAGYCPSSSYQTPLSLEKGGQLARR